MGSLILVATLAASCGGDDDGQDEAVDRPSGTAVEPAPPSPSPGCDTGAGAPVREERRTLTVEGVERWFLLTLPEGRGEGPAPLVLDVHGLAEGAEAHTRMSGFSDVAEEEGFIVAFPNGTGAPVRWDTTISPDGNPDTRYVEAVLDAVGQATCVDESRVYATGLSMGAMMSSVLACTLSDRFAAVAPVAGVLMPDECEPRHPVPVLSFHGTADPILLFNGGVGDALGRALSGNTTGPTTPLPPADLDGEGYPANAAAWADHNGCEARPDGEEVTASVLRRVYRCPRGGAVEFVVVRGGGHSWPGSDFSRAIESIVGPTTDDIDATTEIWRFFQRFQRV